MGQRAGEIERRDPQDVYLETGPSSGRSRGVMENTAIEQSALVDYENSDATGQMADEPDLQVARVQIEQTRAELSGTINAIEERLSPQVLMEQAKEAAQEAARERVDQAKDAIRQATIGKVEGAVNTAAEKVQDVVHSASDAISGAGAQVQGAIGTGAETTGNAMQSSGTVIANTGSGVLDTVKRHPLPAALAAAGLGWLYLSVRKDNAGASNGTRYAGTPPTNHRYPAIETNTDQSQDLGSSPVGQALKAVPDTAGQLTDKANQLTSKAKESMSQLGGQATDQAQRARGGFVNLLTENPLAVGVAVAAAGMLAGLAVPETDKENALLGQAHDAMMDRAGQMAQDTAQRVQSVAQEALSAAKQEAQNQEILPGS